MASERNRNAFFTGRTSNIGTSAVRLTNQDIPAQQGVLVYAAPNNTGSVYVGQSNVTADAADSTDGFPIPSDKALLIPVDNPNKIFVIAPSGTQKAFWMVV